VNRQTIEIDIDVHKAIEARRISFAESANDILRRQFDIRSDRNSDASAGLPRPTLGDKKRRRSGSYTVTWAGGEVSGVSLKDVLKKAILAREKKSPGFLETLSRHRTSRGRRIVARKPEELYPGNPHLVEQGAERLDSRWWLDTNISTGQCQRYLDVVGELSKVGVIRLEKRS
jgi:hypothetical protein